MADNIFAELVEIQNKVRDYFGWDYQDDFLSATSISQAFNSSAPFNITNWSPKNRQANLAALKEKLLAASKVVIVGASVKENDFANFDFENSIVIAADGSVGGVVGMVNLACVVTDFDGNPHLDKVAKEGVTFVAHAHGDNTKRWRKSLDRWSCLESPPNLILTHQVTESIDGVHNFGGFTDGDRAVCLAINLGVPINKITLLGFSTTEIGKWSGQTNPERKMEKLDWMLKILQIIGLEQQVATNAYVEP
ncbi:MAG TPA: hypothetical protein D7I03_01430 [Candidatus Poseidoniales archaeon]|nr:MAG TPA: hypothetical protein D7I03_01430 [Candidatus Poseidoniales archaeon]HII49983.1 hypothetical protein [Candidatus Poseidoniaceae archaeon]